jgi:hypothetical protein
VIVTSVPYLSTLAFPISNKKSLSITLSGASKLTPYIISFSKNITGSSSLIEAFRSPLTSSTLHGATTLSPGTLEYQEAKHYECCAPTPAETPLIPRNTIGHLRSPADM